MRKKIVASFAAAILGIGGGVAYASIPGGDGQVHGCYKDGGIGDGALFVVDSSAVCPAGYTGLNWAQSAPAGIAGYEVIQVQFEKAGPVGAGTISQTASCPVGKVALGASVNGDVMKSQPTLDGSGWEYQIPHPPIGEGSVFSSWQRVTCATKGV